MTDLAVKTSERKATQAGCQICCWGILALVQACNEAFFYASCFGKDTIVTDFKKYREGLVSYIFPYIYRSQLNRATHIFTYIHKQIYLFICILFCLNIAGIACLDFANINVKNLPSRCINTLIILLSGQLFFFFFMRNKAPVAKF